MLYCENGHRTYLRVFVADEGEFLIADSKSLPQNVVEEVVHDMQEGVCPVCSGRMPLMQNGVQ